MGHILPYNSIMPKLGENVFINYNQVGSCPGSDAHSRIRPPSPPRLDSSDGLLGVLASVWRERLFCL